MSKRKARPRFPRHGARFLHQLASDRVSEQLANIRSLDQKLSTLFGVGQGFIGLAAAFFALTEDSPPISALVLLGIAGAFWLNLSLYTLFGYFLRDWDAGPKLPDAWTYADQYDDQVLHWWAAESFISCYAANKKGEKEKVFLIRGATIFLTAETVFILIALGVTAIG